MKRSSLFLFLTATALYWASMYTYPVLLSDFSQTALGASPRMVGAIVGSYGLVQMLLRTPVGFASDLLRRRKPFLTMGMAFSTLAALGLWQARSPMMALLARGTSGAAAAAWVAFSVLYASYGKNGQGARAMGILSAVMYSAQLLATQLGGLLTRLSSTRTAFFSAAIIGGLGILCSLFVTDVRPTGEAPKLSTLSLTLRDRMLLTSAGLSILHMSMAWATLYGFTPQWAKAMFAVDATQLALLSTAQLLPNILFSWLCGTFTAPRLGTRNTCALGFSLLALGTLGMPFTTSFTQMLLLQAVFGTGVGCVAPMLLSLCIRDIPPNRHGIAMGLYQSLYGLGMFAGPVLAGALVQAASPVVNGVTQLTVGYRANFFAMAAVGALAVALCFVFLPRDQRDPLTRRAEKKPST